MLTRTPDYYSDFRCLAGACPHTCCAKWEVVIDEETAQRYQELSGPLGEKLRAVLRYDEDGDACFPLDGGRCPFLDGEGLCEIHRKLGEDATSITCREHPRFVEDYGPFREITLSASCPAANALLLGSREVLTFREREDGAPGEPGDPWLSWLLPLRQRMLALAEDRSRPLKRRLREVLDLASAVQLCLEAEREEGLPGLVGGWQPGNSTGAVPGPGLFPEALSALLELEVLEPDWPGLLKRAETAETAAVEETLLERAAVYFLFRYILKSVNDGDVLGRAEFCVLAVLTVERLAAVCGLSEALRRFSCEIEHSEENLERLLEAFWQRETFSLERFQSELCTT